jgi:hypothetical protein
MSFSLVQSAQSSSGAGNNVTSGSVSFSGNNAANNLLTVEVVCGFNGSTGAQVTPTITDTAGNNWQLVASAVNGPSTIGHPGAVFIFAVLQALAFTGTNTVIANFGTQGQNFIALDIKELSASGGSSNGWAVDQTAVSRRGDSSSDQQNFDTTMTATTASTTMAAEIAVTANANWQGATAPGTGWTGAAFSFLDSAFAVQFLSSTGTVSSTWTVGGSTPAVTANYATAVATFSVVSPTATLSAAQGSFALAGNAATFQASGGATLTAAQGAFSIAAKQADVSADWTHVQHRDTGRIGFTGSGGTLSVTLAAPVAAGHIVAGAVMGNSFGSGQNMTAVSVTDDKGNVYHAGNINNLGDANIVLFWGGPFSNGPSTITATVTNNYAGNSGYLFADEFKLPTSAASISLDMQGANSLTTLPPNFGTLTLAGANELVYVVETIVSGIEGFTGATHWNAIPAVEADTAAAWRTTDGAASLSETPFDGSGSSRWTCAAIVLKTPPAFALPAAPGSFAITGEAAVSTIGINMSAAQGTFALTGYAITVPMGATCGIYTLTGQAATFVQGQIWQPEPPPPATTWPPVDTPQGTWTSVAMPRTSWTRR